MISMVFFVVGFGIWFSVVGAALLEAKSQKDMRPVRQRVARRDQTLQRYNPGTV